MKKFSVCIAFYNQMNYIEDSLKSVFLQDYDNIEVILEDDASDKFDESKIKRIAKRYNKKKFDFKIIRNKKNSGIVKNVNSAFGAITGDYILFLAADDALHDDAVISNFVRVFENKKNINVVTTQCLLCDEKLEKTSGGLFVDYNFAKKMNNSSNKKVYYEMCKNCFYGSGGTAYRKEIFEKYGKFDEKYKYVEDWPLFLKFIRNKEKIYYEDFISLNHRDGGISHNKKTELPKHVKEYYADMKRIYKDEILKKIFYNSFFNIFKLLFFIVKKYLKTLKKKNSVNNEKKHCFVICAYKESPYLEECVKSLLNQSVKSRVIISTSTPNCYIRNIAQKYKVEMIINNKEKGHANDFRYAFNYAKTNYVTLCHQDDIYLKDYAKVVISKMDKVKKPIIAFTNYYEFRSGKIVKNNMLLIVKRIINFPLLLFKTSKRIRLFTLSIGNAISAPTLTYNKKIIENPVVDTDFKSNIDWISYITFAKLKGQFVYIRKPLVLRRIHEESLTTQVISNNIKTEEDYKVFNMFWSEKVSKKLLKLYSKSESSNKIDKKNQ